MKPFQHFYLSTQHLNELDPLITPPSARFRVGDRVWDKIYGPQLVGTLKAIQTDPQLGSLGLVAFPSLPSLMGIPLKSLRVASASTTSLNPLQSHSPGHDLEKQSDGTCSQKYIISSSASKAQIKIGLAFQEIDRLKKQIQELSNEGDWVDGWVTSYKVKQRYTYYELRWRQAGHTKKQHLGKRGSPKYNQAVASVKRARQIKTKQKRIDAIAKTIAKLESQLELHSN